MEAYMENISVLKWKSPNIYNLINEAENLPVFSDEGKEKTEGLENVDDGIEKTEALATIDDGIEEIEILQSADGQNILEVTKSGKRYRMNSIYNISYEADTWISEIDFHPIQKVFVFMGFGNGYYIEKVIERLQVDDTIIVYEPSIRLFTYVLKHFHLQNILQNDNLHLFLGEESISDFKNLLRIRVYINNLSSQKVLILPQYERLFQERVYAFVKAISDNNMSVVLTAKTNAALSEVSIINSFQNLKYLPSCGSIHDYINRFPEEMPAIIVAAGPSLEKNVQELKKAKGRAVIFAVDRALEFLYKADIIPDYAVILDPRKKIDMFANGYTVEIPLFAGLDAKNEILEMHKGKKIWYKSAGYLNWVLYKTKNCIFKEDSYGGSVATAAFSICEQIGFNRIILVGQDLAYADDGKTSHAGDALEGGFTKQDIWVDGIDGNKVKSRLDWYEFLRWYSNEIKLCTSAGIKVVDATEGGAKIEGTEIMKLSEAIEAYCGEEVDISEIEREIPPFFGGKDFANIEKYMDKGIVELRQMKKKALTAEKICDKLIRKVKKKTVEDKTGQKLVFDLKKANAYMATRTVYHLIDQYITEESQDVMKDIFKTTEDIDKNMEDSFVYSKKIYELIQKGSDSITEIIADNFQRWSS